MLKVVATCDGPGCAETREKPVPTGNLQQLEPFIDDWFVLSDQNPPGRPSEARHFCSHRCLASWTLQHQLEGAAP